MYFSLDPTSVPIYVLQNRLLVLSQYPEGPIGTGVFKKGYNGLETLESLSEQKTPQKKG